ncbi:TraX family protein [Gracilibacillus caseinilyticus]|uniref:TraX family protein n=1 Tax=Gracilibacillus caseinilyticus TaxID=2932256 RepID=A0ABY4F367_9BACI|nr:TraX family protein [Gracilibacillus caseinilyticus]UOQ50507.1 TraX family protein [Gracilibacillus caseinilyticus]
MVFALPLILLYNGNRGAGLKYFFYIFYPLHSILLYLIGLLLNQ